MGQQTLYPQIVCNKNRLIHNVETMLAKCNAHHTELVAVTKLCAGDLEIVKLFVDHGITIIGDSRIDNLARFKDINVRKMLLRIPMWSEVSDIAEYADICLISELSTALKIDAAAKLYNRVIELILMIETGDIREGLLDLEIINNFISKVKACKHLKLVGIGTNFACFGATVPEVSKLIKLAELKTQLEKLHEIKLPIISAGNSSHITVWDNTNLPTSVNQMRSGAAIFMGFGLNDEPIPFLKQNVFTLRAQIVEVQIKPSASWGQRGLDAFGEPVQFEDIGPRKKAIIAVGRQDCHHTEIIPLDTKIKVLGSSSDHTILDIHDSAKNYQVGDIIEFNLTYTSTLSCFTSPYVKKIIL